MDKYYSKTIETKYAIADETYHIMRSKFDSRQEAIDDLPYFDRYERDDWRVVRVTVTTEVENG